MSDPADPGLADADTRLADADTGLATERTVLAWQRTALAHLVAGTILLRAVLHEPGWILALVLLVVFTGVAMAWFAALSTAAEVRRGATFVLTGCALALACSSALVIGVSQ